jgi:large subunit ribosomal protein L24
MKVKVGDNVKILVGKDKGKTGKVIKTLKDKQKVVVEGLNLVKKHSKPTNTNDKGGIFDIEAPLHVSNVKVITEEVAKKAEKEVKKAEKVVKKEAKKVTKKATKKVKEGE